MENGIFEEDENSDIEEVDYMFSNEWFSEIDKKSAILFFKETINSLKLSNKEFYLLISTSLNDLENKSLSLILDKY